MALDRITLGHFRNHAATRLDGTARLNLLVGENGAGKTNVLEALSLFAPGRGLRRAALTAKPPGPLPGAGTAERRWRNWRAAADRAASPSAPRSIAAMAARP